MLEKAGDGADAEGKMTATGVETTVDYDQRRCSRDHITLSKSVIIITEQYFRFKQRSRYEQDAPQRASEARRGRREAALVMQENGRQKKENRKGRA